MRAGAKDTIPVGAGADITPLGRMLELLPLPWAVDHALHRVSRRMPSLLGVIGPQRFALRSIGRFPELAAERLDREGHG
jgi:hypothetical protein